MTGKDYIYTGAKEHRYRGGRRRYRQRGIRTKERALDYHEVGEKEEDHRKEVAEGAH